MLKPPEHYARLQLALDRADSPALDHLLPAVLSLTNRLDLRIGGTPLTEVPAAFGDGTVLAKWESANEFGSVKDRVAVALIAHALATELDEEMGFVEYTGGSLGISLAAIASALRIPATLVMSESTAASIIRRCEQEGAVVELVGGDPGFADVMLHAVEHAEASGRRLLFQHTNPACREIHSQWTGQELVDQLGLMRCDALVAPIGTGGTLAGCVDRLRSCGMATVAIGVTPAELPYGSAAPPNSAPKLAGSGGLGHCMQQPFVARINDPAHTSDLVAYPRALAGMHRFHEMTGRWIGSSAAAAWLVASQRLLGGSSKEWTIAIFPSAGTPEEQERAASIDPAELHRGL